MKLLNKLKETITLITISVASSYLVFETLAIFCGAKLGLMITAIILFSILFKLSE